MVKIDCICGESVVSPYPAVIKAFQAKHASGINGAGHKITLDRFVLGLPPPPVCANCYEPFTPTVHLLTCSAPCHAAYVESVVAVFGETKIVVDVQSGKRYAVPTRDICERGLKYEDLPMYPEAACES